VDDSLLPVERSNRRHRCEWRADHHDRRSIWILQLQPIKSLVSLSARMKLKRAVLGFLGLTSDRSGHGKPDQYRFSRPAVDSSEVLLPRIAIIGCGAAGSSAAYFLQFLSLSNSSLRSDATVYEKSDYIGGRSTTVLPPPDVDTDQSPIELGASLFVPANFNLNKAAKVFNLTLQDGMGGNETFDPTVPSLAIWDGAKFVYTQGSGKTSYWEMLNLWWKFV
jgi:hypothetical protein